MTSRIDQPRGLNADQETLWRAIVSHEMPADAAGVTFQEQLMRAYKIKPGTALIAIDEYRKFMFLCATRTARNVPSKAVDLVWHLHMQHTRDYWDVFCAKLGKPVHHTPGGTGWAHLDDYKATMDAYRAWFGRPPKGIWREGSRAAGVFGAVLGVAILLTAFTIGGGVSAGNLIAMGVGGVFVIVGLRSCTSQGVFTLTFETGDPFADNDAGDCGSGDCGGCGD